MDPEIIYGCKNLSGIVSPEVLPELVAKEKSSDAVYVSSSDNDMKPKLHLMSSFPKQIKRV